MLHKIEELLSEIKELGAANAEQVEAIRIKYLSKKGTISLLMDDFRNVPAEQKREVGIKLNELKQAAQEKLKALKDNLDGDSTQSEIIDLSRTAYPIPLGSRHPLSIVEEEISDILCDKCGKNMVVKSGRFGKFLTCPAYPECKNTKPILDELDVKCPKCSGAIVRKRSKKGRVFYGCINYPDCDFVSWDEPIQEKCPKCGQYMIIKRNKNNEIIKCSNKECGFIIIPKE